MDKQKLISWIAENRFRPNFFDEEAWAIDADSLLNAIENGEFDESGE